MTVFDGDCFKGIQVTLDGNAFRACDFVDVTFRFLGAEGFEVDRDCTFTGEVRLDLSAHARMALLSFMSMFGHAEFGPLIKALIDKEMAKGPDAID